MAGISSLTSRDAVVQAMAEYDRLGREAFLAKYRFGSAKWWYVVHKDKQYDSKAIVGVAIGIQTGRPLTSNDYRGGEGSVVRKLNSLGFTVMRLPLTDKTTKLPEEVSESYPEGLRTAVVVNRAERSVDARLACIGVHGLECSVCGMAFSDTYGAEFTGLIHVHHLTPLAGRTTMRQVDPRRDLSPVCPNCHAAIHYGGKTRTIGAVRLALTNARELSNRRLQPATTRPKTRPAPARKREPRGRG